VIFDRIWAKKTPSVTKIFAVFLNYIKINAKICPKNEVKFNLLLFIKISIRKMNQKFAIWIYLKDFLKE
jgi:hypothetical protein